jgi:hypothetical protein
LNGGDEWEGDHSGQPDLTPDLKAVESDLAMLRPRKDRLDRERLVFLAGQASVGGAAGHPGTHLHRWAWPASFASMTAVAAALLTLLLARPEPPVIERIVYTAAQPGPGDAVALTGDAPGTSSPRYPASVAAATADHAPPSFSLVAAASLPGSLPAGGLKFRLFDHLLVEQLHVRMKQAASSGDFADRLNRRILSPRQLNELLDESAAVDSRSDWPSSQSNPNAGANS